jgi:hypothetical protein
LTFPLVDVTDIPEANCITRESFTHEMTMPLSSLVGCVFVPLEPDVDEQATRARPPRTAAERTNRELRDVMEHRLRRRVRVGRGVGY